MGLENGSVESMVTVPRDRGENSSAMMEKAFSFLVGGLSNMYGGPK